MKLGLKEYQTFRLNVHLPETTTMEKRLTSQWLAGKLTDDEFTRWMGLIGKKDPLK